MLKVTLINLGTQPAVIFDETRPRPTTDYCLEGFTPEPLRQFQNMPLVRGAAPFLADRFNMYSKWDFTVLHSFGTSLACADFIGNRPSLVRTGELQIYFSLGGQVWNRFYKSAFLTSVRPVRGKCYPVSATFEYSLIMPSLFSQTP